MPGLKIMERGSTINGDFYRKTAKYLVKWIRTHDCTQHRSQLQSCTVYLAQNCYAYRFRNRMIEQQNVWTGTRCVSFLRAMLHALLRVMLHREFRPFNYCNREFQETGFWPFFPQAEVWGAQEQVLVQVVSIQWDQAYLISGEIIKSTVLGSIWGRFSFNY